MLMLAVDEGSQKDSISFTVSPALGVPLDGCVPEYLVISRAAPVCTPQ